MNELSLPKCAKISSKPSNFCSGCGHSLVLKNLGFVIDELGVAGETIFTTDIGCSLLAWDYFDIDTIQSHHGRVTALATGLKRAKPKSNVIAYMGDGGGYAIGLQYLLGAARRDEPLLVILVNNTLFAMTGGQMAPTTFRGEDTSSTPGGSFTDEPPIMGPELIKVVASKNSFIARASVDNADQLQNYLKKAFATQLSGHFAFVEILSYCPTNWKTDAKKTIDFLDQIKQIYPTGVINGE